MNVIVQGNYAKTFLIRCFQLNQCGTR
jgi:hypothetical protein